MKLPIDIKELMKEATDIKAARSTELSVSIYMDNTAPADLVAHIRGAFASTQPTLRMTVSYLDSSFVPHAGDDFAIIVAGQSRSIGAASAALRAMGVPVMVVTTMPGAVERAAEEAGYAIPEGDIVSPRAAEGANEPILLDDEAKDQLDTRMGGWVVAVCREKRLAMAIAFGFMRRSLARDAVQATSIQNAGIGLVPIIPGAELPIMTLNQAKMVLQIAASYGEEIDKNRVKELAAVVGGAYLCRTVARSLVELVPVLGFVIKPGIAYGGTSAVGYAAIDYFEGGKDAAGVMNVVTHATEAGNKFVSKVREEGPALVPELLGKAKSLDRYIPVARQKVEEYKPRVMAAVNTLAESVAAQTKAAN